MPYQVTFGAIITTEGFSPLRVVFDWDRNDAEPEHAYICILEAWVGETEVGASLSSTALDMLSEKIGRGMQRDPPDAEMRAKVAEEMKEHRLADPIHGWIIAGNWEALKTHGGTTLESAVRYDPTVLHPAPKNFQ